MSIRSNDETQQLGQRRRAPTDEERQEIARLGREMYEQRVKPLLKPEDEDKFVVLDIHTGEFEVDVDQLAAMQRMRDRNPSSQRWLERVGWPAAHRLWERVMIRGVVNVRNEAVVTLILHGPRGAITDVEAVIDTGFTEALTLAGNIIGYLDLDYDSSARMIPGDGSIVPYDLYTVEVDWDGIWRTITASAIGKHPLIGAELLAGYSLHIDFTPGGAVAITSIP